MGLMTPVPIHNGKTAADNAFQIAAELMIQLSKQYQNGAISHNNYNLDWMKSMEH